MKKTKMSHEVNISTKGSRTKTEIDIPKKKYLQSPDQMKLDWDWEPKDQDISTTSQGREYKWADTEEVQETLENYFKECAEIGKPPTISGLCVVLGCHRSVFHDWEKNIKNQYPPWIVHLLRQAKSICHNWIEENALQGKANAAFSIFVLKNSYGYVDKVETDITSNGENVTTQPITINMPNTKSVSSSENAIRTIKDPNDVDVDKVPHEVSTSTVGSDVKN